MRLGEQRYALPASSVREIVPMAALTVVPGQAELLEGFLNFRGTAIPVIRLRRLFRLPHENFQVYTPLVIFDAGGLVAALEADVVEEVAEIDEASVRPMEDGHSANDCAEAVFRLNGRDVPLLACERLLLAKERECLSELQTAIQNRLNALSSVTQ